MKEIEMVKLVNYPLKAGYKNAVNHSFLGHLKDIEKPTSNFAQEYKIGIRNKDQLLYKQWTPQDDFKSFSLLRFHKRLTVKKMVMIIISL